MEYKTFDELKDELGDSFEEYMYKANINLLEQRRKAIEFVKTEHNTYPSAKEWRQALINILEGDK